METFNKSDDLCLHGEQLEDDPFSSLNFKETIGFEDDVNVEENVDFEEPITYDDDLDFDETLEVFEEAREGTGITLQCSNEKGFHGRWSSKKEKLSGCSYNYCVLDSIRRRERLLVLYLIIGLTLIVAFFTLLVTKRTSESSTISSTNEMRKNGVGSRFPIRGEGGGAGNLGFVHLSNKNAFANDDVIIPPFSTFDPTEDLDRFGFDRPSSSSPSARLSHLKRAVPTNAWYQNMLRLDVNEEPTAAHRVYTVPYVLDAAGDFAGIRLHATRFEATPTQMRIATDEPYALTLGAMSDVNNDLMTTELDKGYSVHEANDLGLTLQWNSFMKTTLVRGSPYVTMIYNMVDHATTQGFLPTMHWRLDTSELPIVDGNRKVNCESEPVFTVQRDIELAFLNSGQRWLIFFSKPVQLQCKNSQGSPTILQVLKGQDFYDDHTLVIRGAVVIESSNPASDAEAFSDMYANQLRASANVYPGDQTAVTHSFHKHKRKARISFNWDPRKMRLENSVVVGEESTDIRDTYGEMIMFALPHHLEVLQGNVFQTLCTSSLLGPICLVEGNVWNMYEELPGVSFQAERSPEPKYVPLLAEALLEDIRYQVPSNFFSGAGDTYFSGKTFAKLARILLINEEIKMMCTSALQFRNSQYWDACDGLVLPSDEEVENALNQLRAGVTVWVKTNSETPFVYDNAWGGLISCGCIYQNEKCVNRFPDCPAFTDQGLNFGNGFYNDHHFHYGYHVYAAAVLAHFDSSWAIDHYEDVTLLVRDYANASEEDTAFPVFRNKDWYRGHSWASGLTEPMFGNIMNQESSSEAVMAYEAIALFGKTMATIFHHAGDTEQAHTANMMHKIGLTLTATEIRSTQHYYQVQQKSRISESYGASVVGIFWETFAEFTTWFGNAPYLIYGIQLMPLTAISEARDSVQWAREIVQPLMESCDAACVSEGWSVQLHAIQATIGRVQEAIDGILQIPGSAYKHAGGNGHSKSNSLWYASTRPPVTNPVLGNEDESEQIVGGDDAVDKVEVNDYGDAGLDLYVDDDADSFDFDPHEGFDVYGDDDGFDDDDDDPHSVDDDDLSAFDPVRCFHREECASVLDNKAGPYSCRDRIKYLRDVLQREELDACRQVAVFEYPTECGLCGPHNR